MPAVIPIPPYSASLKAKPLFLQGLKIFYVVIMTSDDLQLIRVDFVKRGDPLSLADPDTVHFRAFHWVILLFRFHKRFPLPSAFKIATSMPRPLTYSERFAAFSHSRSASIRSLAPNVHPFFPIISCCTFIVPPSLL